MRRSTLRFPSDFKIFFSLDILLDLNCTLCANVDVKDILRSPRPP